MNYYDGIAKDVRQARQAAGEFFKNNFNHSGNVGVERIFTAHCDCVTAAGIEFYSKDDPGMVDTFTVVVCDPLL